MSGKRYWAKQGMAELVSHCQSDFPELCHISFTGDCVETALSLPPVGASHTHTHTLTNIHTQMLLHIET